MIQAIHWTHFLPEAGTITKKGDKQILLMLEILRLRRKIADIQEEINEGEREIYQTALKEWGQAEMDAAMKESINRLKAEQVQYGHGKLVSVYDMAEKYKQIDGKKIFRKY